MAQLLTTPRY